MKKNEKVIIKITDLNSDGAGVGRNDGVVVFVPYALPDETVEALIIKVAKNYCVGKLLRVMEKSEFRTEPKCPYFYRCGGCDFQHMEYSAQLEQKCASAMKNISKISGQNLKIEKIIGAEKIWNYRTKAQFPVGKDKNGSTVAGFFSPKSHNIVPIENCMLQSEKCNSALSAVLDAIKETNLSVYDEKTHKGILRHIISRSSESGLMLIVVTNTKKRLPENFVSAVKKNLPEMTSFVQNINCSAGNIILGSENIFIWGENYLPDELCGIKFNLRPLAFLQVNPFQAEKLYNTAVEKANLTGNETVFDAYCGIGVMSLMLAKKAKQLIGVEIIPEAIDSAKESAELNGINNTEFIAGKCEDVLPELIKSGKKPDVLVVDPPRAGCEESLLNAVADADIKRIVYVSCNPATLARDIAVLALRGYSCSDITFVDMFCHTKHIETVALLSRQKVDEHIYLDVNVQDLPKTARTTATYPEIKAYVKDKYGLNVTSLNIAQVKEKHGFEKRENYNKGKDGHRVPNCPPEKEKAIEDAFKHFGMH